MTKHSRLRVAVPVPLLPAQAGGGSSLQARIFHEILHRSSRECDLSYLFLCDSFESLQCLNKLNVSREQIIDIASFRSKNFLASLEKKLKHVKKLLNPDYHIILQADRKCDHAIRSSADILWSLSAEPPVFTIPFVVTVWDIQHRFQPFFPEVSSEGRWLRRENAARTIFPQATFNVVGTERGKLELEKYYGVDNQRIVVNPFPAPIPCHSPHPETVELVNGFKPFIIYPAQFWAHKNHVNLLKALKITRDSGFDLQLVLTGSDHGTQKTVKALILELELNNSVHVLGFVSDKLLASLYAACSLLCFPSYFGPDNLPPLEALAYHKPVIVADVPGARDQLGDSALYFNPNSPHEIATLMMAIVSDVDIRRKLDISGSKLISERTTKNYVDIIESNLLTLLPAFENFRSRSSRV